MTHIYQTSNNINLHLRIKKKPMIKSSVVLKEEEFLMCSYNMNALIMQDRDKEQRAMHVVCKNIMNQFHFVL